MNKINNLINDFKLKHTDEQILALSSMIFCIVLTLFFAIVRICGGLWFTLDFDSITEPPKLAQQFIMAFLQILEMVFCYKLLCRTSWLWSLILASIHTIISSCGIPYPWYMIVSNLFWLICGLATTKRWKTIIEFIFLFTVISLYGIVFLQGTVGSVSVQSTNFIVSILGAIDYKLFIISLYLVINYFGGIKLWKRKKTVILLETPLSKKEVGEMSQVAHSCSSETKNQQ